MAIFDISFAHKNCGHLAVVGRDDLRDLLALSLRLLDFDLPSVAVKNFSSRCFILLLLLLGARLSFISMAKIAIRGKRKKRGKGINHNQRNKREDVIIAD